MISSGGRVSRYPPEAPAEPVRQGDIPDKVFALMQTSNIFEEEVRKVFSGKGYYPEDTPWSILEAEGFVDGWIIPQWGNIVAMALQDRPLPF